MCAFLSKHTIQKKAVVPKDFFVTESVFLDLMLPNVKVMTKIA